MTVDLSSYKVGSGETSSSTKFDNLVQAVQDALNVDPPGTQYTYDEATASVIVSAASEATATTVVTASAHTFDGATAVWVEFWCPWVDPQPGAGEFLRFCLYDGASSIGLLGLFEATAGAGSSFTPGTMRRRLVPSGAAHTYSIRAFRGITNGTVGAGVGGVGADMPMYIRTVKA